MNKYLNRTVCASPKVKRFLYALMRTEQNRLGLSRTYNDMLVLLIKDFIKHNPDKWEAVKDFLRPHPNQTVVQRSKPDKKELPPADDTTGDYSAGEE